MKEDASVANCARNSRPAHHRRNGAPLAPPWGVQTCGSRKGRGAGCTAAVVGQSSTTGPIFLRLGLILITQQPGYQSGRNFSKLQLVFDDGLHAPIADTKLLANFNHSKPTIAFNKVTNRCDVLWGGACPWASLMTWVLHGISSSTKLFMPESNVYWTVHHCNSWRMKDQLDVTCCLYFTYICSTCFEH